MDHYIDIRLLRDPEFSPAHLMNALFAKLHRILVQQTSSDLGISFPDAGRRSGLGACLRLHGKKARLEGLMACQWLTGMRDHMAQGPITEVPATAGHQVVRRVQAKSSPDRLRRRQMKRKGWSEEQARAAIPDSVAERLELPFLTLRSTSTDQHFRLFLEQKVVPAAMPGDFNAYGLSQSATVPKF